MATHATTPIEEGFVTSVLATIDLTAASPSIPSTLSYSSGLECIDPILASRSAVIEGDAFAATCDLPFVIRSREFAPVNGALDCTTQDLPRDKSFADRLWNADERRLIAVIPSEYLPFDVKSTNGGSAELISNWYQEPHDFYSAAEEDKKKVWVRASRTSTLPAAEWILVLRHTVCLLVFFKRL